MLLILNIEVFNIFLNKLICKLVDKNLYADMLKTIIVFYVIEKKKRLLFFVNDFLI